MEQWGIHHLQKNKPQNGRGVCLFIFIVQCFNLTEIQDQQEHWLLHMLEHRVLRFRQHLTPVDGINALLFIKFKIKIYFQTCGFGLFLYITLFSCRKNKIVQLHKYKILPPWKWLKHSIKTARDGLYRRKKRKYTKQNPYSRHWWQW